jgi:hypothetical protein
MNTSLVNGIITCLFLSINLSAHFNPTKAQRRIFQSICAYQGPRTALLSFPHSGNTWLRYCLEFLTNRPTLYRDTNHPRWNEFLISWPVAWQAMLEIDNNKPLIEKMHCIRETMLRGKNETICLNPDVDKLMFILRNPKETIARVEYSNFDTLLEATCRIYYPHHFYFENLALFDSWPAERRHLVYYEDLITKPRETLAAILAFLQEPDTRLDQFMDEYEEHKNRSLSLYSGATSRGSDPLFHSKKLSAQYRKQVDTWIADAYPELWEKYLQRYHESD